jgi:hypothetical protein
MVQMQGESAAGELSHVLGGRGSYDYDRLKIDAELGRIGTQEIITAKGVAALYDIRGQNQRFRTASQSEARRAEFPRAGGQEFPELSKYVRRSFTESKVKGYFIF